MVLYIEMYNMNNEHLHASITLDYKPDFFAEHISWFWNDSQAYKNQKGILPQRLRHQIFI